MSSVSLSESRTSRSASLSIPTHTEHHHHQTSSVVSNDPLLQLKAEKELQGHLKEFQGNKLKELAQELFPSYATRLHLPHIQDARNVKILSIATKDLESHRIEVFFKNDLDKESSLEMKLDISSEDEEDPLVLWENAKKAYQIASEQYAKVTKAKEWHCTIQ